MQCNGMEYLLLPTHPTGRRTGLDIRRNCNSLEILVSGDLRYITDMLA